jgi:hypothetical protein
MKVIFDHKFGAQEQIHLEHYSAELTEVKENEHDTALEQGWLTDLNDDKNWSWYQCRSTRCNLKKTDYKMYSDNLYKCLEDASDRPVEIIEKLYEDYCNYKNFNNLFYTEVKHWLECDVLMMYYDIDCVAWSKLRLYTKDALEAVLFTWNYENPELKIGINSLKHELAWAKENGFKYMYLGPGYESGSIYKANIDGFEWWTGSEWSTNTVEYIRLCKRDSKLKTIKQLSEI